MTQGIASIVEVRFQIAAHHAGLHGRQKRDLIQLQDVCHAAHIEHRSAGEGYSTPYHTRPGPERDDGHPFSLSLLEDTGHLRTVRWPEYQARNGELTAVLGALHAYRPPVKRVTHQVVFVEGVASLRQR